MDRCIVHVSAYLLQCSVACLFARTQCRSVRCGVCVCVCVCVCARVCEHECMCFWQLLSIAYLQGGIKTGGLFTLGSSFRAKQPCLSVIQIGGFTPHIHKQTHTHIYTHTYTHTQTYRHSTASPTTPFPILPHISSHFILLLR